MFHHTIMPFSPASTRRVILSVIFSSGIAKRDPNPFRVVMVLLPLHVSAPLIRPMNPAAYKEIGSSPRSRSGWTHTRQGKTVKLAWDLAIELTRRGETPGIQNGCRQLRSD